MFVVHSGAALGGHKKVSPIIVMLSYVGAALIIELLGVGHRFVIVIFDVVLGNVVVATPGVFVFSRRSAPFGFNGAYYYVGADFSF